MEYDNVYWDEDALRDNRKSPTILAIGDSWFWYFLVGGSLVNQLGKLVAPADHVIYAVGKNGAEVYDYVHGKNRKAVTTALEFYGAGLSCVFISGGGNDFAGFSDQRPLLKNDCSRIGTARNCFKPGHGKHTLGWLMDKTESSYRELIGRIVAHTQATTRIVMHNYDYARPDGKGVFGTRAKWLKSALVDAGVRETLHQGCINHLIDRFTVVLEKVVSMNPERLTLVDSRNTLTPGDWANELHPKPSGFRKIARTRWMPVLERIGVV